MKKTVLVLILMILWMIGFDKPEAALAHFQESDCAELTDINVIHLESAGTDFEPFQAKDDILFFGNIDASLDTIRNRENGEHFYCDYLKSRQPVFPADTSIYTYPYLGPDYMLAPTENGAYIVGLPEQIPELGREGSQIPDRWWDMLHLIAFMTDRDQGIRESSSEPRYSLDEIMAEPRALAQAYINAKLWSADLQMWSADPKEALQITVVGESFGTAFARAFLVALAEHMGEIGYAESDIQTALTSVRFLAIADVIPPYVPETRSLWAWLAFIPTLSVIHANEDFARYYGALPYYEQYVPLDSQGSLTEGIWPLVGERYLYVKIALDQANVHGVEPNELAGDPLWLNLWALLQRGAPLSETLELAAGN